jgi:AI-2 transport protein TqsA
MGVVERSISFLTGGVNLVVGLATTLFLAVAIMVFLLVEAPRFQRRARAVLGERRSATLADTMGRISRHTRRYAAAKTLGGLIAGAATGLLAWALGIPQPLAWGVLSMAMNYIPNIGILISAAPPALLALTLQGPGTAAIFVGGVTIVEALIGNVFDPLVEGKALRLPSVLVLIALVFWAWLWGVAGALLCVPLTAAILTGLEQFPRTRELAALLRRQPERTPEKGRP